MSAGFVTDADAGAPGFIVSSDPLEVVSDSTKEVAKQGKKDSGIVHIRCQQRNGRKCITSIQGLPPNLDFKKLLKHFKKQFSCNGSIVENEDHGTVVQLQGDQRANAEKFLTEQRIVKKSDLVLHGF